MSKPQQYYQAGGTLKPDDPSYIERQADINLFEGLAGKFCYVFNSRQMGKSSLQVRVSKRLANEGFRCVLISLESFGTRGVTQKRWYYTFIQDLADKFELPTELLETWLHESRSLAHVKRFSEFLEKILLPEVYQNIIIFIDEIDTVLSLDFPTNDFFAFIRYCYNQRAINPNFKRITFCLLGVATPSQLIQDNQRTPFNIGEAIQLKGFSFDEARTLAQGLKSKVSDYKIAEAIIQEILNWTDGQPFLTQKICEIIVDNEQIIPVDKRLIRKWVEQLVICRIINNWEEQDNPQLLYFLLCDSARQSHARCYNGGNLRCSTGSSTGGNPRTALACLCVRKKLFAATFIISNKHSALLCAYLSVPLRLKTQK